jgi:class 3 adenylate cyclase
VLFADIKSPTELMEDRDPEEARAIVDLTVRVVVEAVRRDEGYVAQSGEELREHGSASRRRWGACARRAGVNMGEVVVRSVEIGGKVEYTPIGHTLNLGSRLDMLAPAGSIAVSEYTRKLCEGYFELRSLGPMAVEGISEPITVYG